LLTSERTFTRCVVFSESDDETCSLTVV
jgi:hypothetical protein